jgi:hypothetical protein
MPTKTLVASAYAARLAARAAEYGVVIDGRIAIDMARVKARKDAVSNTAMRNIETWLRAMPGVAVYQGEARFVSPREIEVGADRISADKIFINVGGKAVVPAIAGLGSVPLPDERIDYGNRVRAGAPKRGDQGHPRARADSRLRSRRNAPASKRRTQAYAPPSTRLQVQPRLTARMFFSPSAVALIPTSLVLKRLASTLTATALSSPTKC